jgi:hypothetical protein
VTAEIHFPERTRLDPALKSVIRPLPTYHLNEGIITELIQIINKVSSDVGLSSEQIQEKLLLFKGDLATTKLIGTTI